MRPDDWPSHVDIARLLLGAASSVLINAAVHTRPLALVAPPSLRGFSHLRPAQPSSPQWAWVGFTNVGNAFGSPSEKATLAHRHTIHMCAFTGFFATLLCGAAVCLLDSKGGWARQIGSGTSVAAPGTYIRAALSSVSRDAGQGAPRCWGSHGVEGPGLSRCGTCSLGLFGLSRGFFSHTYRPTSLSSESSANASSGAFPLCDAAEGWHDGLWRPLHLERVVQMCEAVIIPESNSRSVRSLPYHLSVQV